MVCASKSAAYNFAETQFGAAMQTPIIMHTYLAGRVAPHDDVPPEPRQTQRSLLHMRRLTNRIPHVVKTNAKFSFEFHLRAQWKTKPPSATINCPVIKDASSDRRKETSPAMSSTVPSRGMARF